jgi:hypothetical protein
VDRLVAFQVADRVPLEVGAPLRTTSFQGYSDRGAFYERVRRLEELDAQQAGFAREHANAVFEVLAVTLDPDSRTLLSKDLPDDLAALLRRPATEPSASEPGAVGAAMSAGAAAAGEAAASEPGARASEPGTSASEPGTSASEPGTSASEPGGRGTSGAEPGAPSSGTLATGRPGHGNSPAVTPDAAPVGSVLREDNPRRQTKLASTPGPSAERQGHTAAEAEPPIAEHAEDEDETD